MPKVDIKRLDSVTNNDTTATKQINDNFQALQQAIENTISRDGTVPNYMDANFDLNSYRIINAGDPVGDQDVVTLKYFEEKAGGAIEAAAEAKASASQAASSAQSAIVASNNAIGQLAQAEGLLTAAEGQLEETQQYIDAAKSNIDSTVAQAKADVNSAVDEATMDISNTSTAAINTINTAVSNAESNISTIVSDAEGSITSIVVTEANKAIANAAQEATDTAKANVNSYVDGTVKPSLQTYVDQAQENANSAATSMEQSALSATAASNYASNASADAGNAAESAGQAANSAASAATSKTNAKIWADGTDSEVQALGGVHSSKGWSEAAQAVVNGKQDISNLSQTLDNSTTKYPSNKAVKTAIDAKDSLPSQSGQSGKFLTTNGTTASWADVGSKINTPFSLLDYKWSEYEITNASWLLSNGQFNSGATYPSVYELLLKIKNGTETKDGVSVKLSTEAYTDTDFVINTADTTFRLPIKVKLPNSKGVAGNGGNLNVGGSGNALPLYTNGSKTVQTEYYSGGLNNLQINTDPTKSGIEVKDDSSIYLYFYVGETIQDANVIAASQVLTKVANGIDRTVKSDRETVVGWGMPDYSAGITINATSYTAPKDGIVLINCQHADHATNQLTINGVQLYSVSMTGSYAAGTLPPFEIPVSAGDVIKSNQNILRFFPYKGA